jgi:hypothetical protein
MEPWRAIFTRSAETKTYLSVRRAFFDSGFHSSQELGCPEEANRPFDGMTLEYGDSDDLTLPTRLHEEAGRSSMVISSD